MDNYEIIKRIGTGFNAWYNFYIYILIIIYEFLNKG